MKEKTEDILRACAALHERLIAQSGLVEQVAGRLTDVIEAGGTIYVMGNGGSAADAQHMACELVGRFMVERRALPCVALTADTITMTAIANDYGFGSVFVRQVAALVKKGDAVVGISTSGNSVNVNAAIAEARKRGALTVGLTGKDGGALARDCDLAVVVPSEVTPRIQEAHATIIHILCALIEQEFCGKK